MPTHHLVSSHTPQQTLPRSLVLPVISRRFTSSLAHSHGVVLHSLLLSGFTFCFFLFPSFPSLPLSLSHAHTHSHTQRKPSSHLIAFPFFLRRDLWLGECWRQAITMSCLNSSVRQSGRGGSGDIRWGGGLYRDTLLLRTLPFALAHVSPAPAPHTAVLSSASGSGSGVLTALLSVFPQSHSTAGRT